MQAIELNGENGGYGIEMVPPRWALQFPVKIHHNIIVKALSNLGNIKLNLDLVLI